MRLSLNTQFSMWNWSMKGLQRQYNISFYRTHSAMLLFERTLFQAPTNAPRRPKEVVGWPRPLPHLGQVTGVAVNSHGQPVIFHRGPRVWDARYTAPLSSSMFTHMTKQTTPCCYGATRFIDLTTKARYRFWVGSVRSHGHNLPKTAHGRVHN